ncbi:MAG: hypothetical protein KKF44_11795 [Nanoarchaeota archaeon]|nr:hypothetical protein [Nanoarchaeota archaeon]
MKKKYVVGVMLVLAILAFSTSALASMQIGPAPNSGDGIPDGSGLDDPFQNGEPTADSPGPSLCAGDGIPDGSCF